MKFAIRLATARTLLVAAALAVVSVLPLTNIAQADPAAAAQVRAKATTHPGFGPGPVVLPYPENVWPQAWSDIKPDPDIRFGTLPNGMRYAIMKNATPSGEASLRLRFDAGSLMENDQQQGLAHFLEHMAFNGSKDVPEGDMIKILQRLGLAFGADTNASTGQTQTIYQLDLPNTKDETVDTALMLFRQAASELTIAPDAVDRERGVVLSEERSRDSPDYRLAKQELAFVLGADNVISRRWPIGQADILRNAPATQIQDYYHHYYQPQRAVLVMVGDFDVAAMEAKIKARFADWKPNGPQGAEPPLTLPLKREPAVKIGVEPGAQPAVSLSWIAPPDLDPDTSAERTEKLIEGLGFAVLNRRLERLARSANPPFIAAGGYRSDYFKSAQVTSVQVNAQPGRLNEGMTAALLEVRRIVEFGVTQAELDREIAAVRTNTESSAAEAATRRTPSLANMITGSLEDSNVVTSPDQDLTMFNAAVKTVSIDKVNAALKEAFAGSGPLAFLSSPTEVAGGEAGAKAALDAALSQPVQQAADQQIKEWPYTDFGQPGKIAEEKDVLDLDTVLVRYENGVRLTIKPTRFRDEQVLVSVRIGAGKMNMPADRTPADWALSNALIDGGLKDLTAEEVEQIMTDKVVGADIRDDDDAWTLSGATRPADLTTEMQLLAAYVTAPGWRPEAFNRIKTYYGTMHDQLEATATGVVNRDLGLLLHAGDKRWAFPSPQEIAAAQSQDVRDLVQPAFSDGPIEIIIVGDTTVEKAEAAVAATFGALPPRPGAQWHEPPTPNVQFPQPNTAPKVLTHKGRADQSTAVMAWKTDDFFTDMHRARVMRVLAAIMNNRLIEKLREEQGTTYSPQASAYASSAFPGYGYLAAIVETPPENLNTFFETVEGVADDLRQHPVGDDELQRAIQPQIDALKKQFENNSFWLGQLVDVQTDPRRLTAIRSSLADLQTVTAQDVMAAAQSYLKPGQSWSLEVVPEGGVDQ